MNGDKEVLGLWLAQTEGAKFWLQVVTECVFRSMPGHDSGACRARIPVDAGPPFRSMPAGVSKAG
jgi:hypothetical protein